MSERADRLRAMADAAEAEDSLAAGMEKARETYRADPSEENKAAYRQAVQALADARQLSRADRESLTVVTEG